MSLDNMGKGLEFKLYTGADAEYQDRLKNPKREPHRCDDRIEDFCRVLLHSNHLESLDSLKTAWGTLWACLNSDEGQEPHDPYVMLPPTDAAFRDHSSMAEQQHEQRRWKPSEQQQQQQAAEQQEEELQPKPWWRRQT